MKSTHILLLTLFLSSALILGCSEDPEDETLTPSEQLPQISFDLMGNTIVDEPKVASTMLIMDQGDTLYYGRTGIEFRGASSQALFPKKSYGIELWDESDDGIDASIFGMPEEEDWVLHGPYSDKSLMRNKLIYDLARDMGMYASRCRFVELQINNNEEGVYVFMEKLKRDKGRIDLNNLKDDENEGEDLTGGYILKIDKTAGNNLGEGYNDLNSFMSTYDPPFANSTQEIYFLYEDPDAEDITEQQKEYISQYVHDFEAALASDHFTDPDTGYRAYIEIESFIDFFLLNELSNNVDAYRLSTFMNKDKNGKLNMGPIWDFNIAFGNANYCGGNSSSVWAYQFNARCPDDFWLTPFWWDRLLEDPTYVTALQDRWNTLRQSTLSTAAIHNRIDQDVDLLERTGAAEDNFSIWPVLGEYIWPNDYIGQSYEDEINQLKSFIEVRASWMDQAIMNL